MLCCHLLYSYIWSHSESAAYSRHEWRIHHPQVFLGVIGDILVGSHLHSFLGRIASGLLLCSHQGTMGFVANFWRVWRHTDSREWTDKWTRGPLALNTRASWSLQIGGQVLGVRIRCFHYFSMEGCSESVVPANGIFYLNIVLLSCIGESRVPHSSFVDSHVAWWPHLHLSY